jgi:cell division protein FtsL
VKKISTILVLLAVITFTSIAIAEDNKSTLTTKNNIQMEKLQIIAKEPSNQDLYKLLYENSSSSNDRIISTIQWSIGIISTFVS